MNDTTPPPPPAGWYPDPEESARLRWWDGNQWGPVQPNEPAATNGKESEFSDAEQQPRKRRSAAPSLIIAFVALFMLWAPILAFLIAATSVVLALRLLKSSSALKRDRSNAKIALGVAGFSFILALNFMIDSSGAPTTHSDPVSGGSPSADELFEPAHYAELGERDFAMLVKDPSGHRGERIVVYGVVTQFDSKTGPCTFRADTDSVPHQDRWAYQENTFIAGANDLTCAFLEKNVVNGDHFQAWVEVDGVADYKTQIGGRMTALELSALQIESREPLS